MISIDITAPLWVVLFFAVLMVLDAVLRLIGVLLARKTARKTARLEEERLELGRKRLEAMTTQRRANRRN